MYVCMYVIFVCMVVPKTNPLRAPHLTFLHALVSSSLTSSLFLNALLIQNCHTTIYSSTTGRRRIFCLFFSSPLSPCALTRPSFFFLSRVSWPSSNSKAASLTSSTCSTSRARSRRLLSRSLGFATHCFLQFFRASRIVTLWQQYSYLLRRRRPRICQPADPLSLTCPMPPTPLPDRACFLRNGQGRPVPSWISLMDNHRRRNR